MSGFFKSSLALCALAVFMCLPLSANAQVLTGYFDAETPVQDISPPPPLTEPAFKQPPVSVPLSAPVFEPPPEGEPVDLDADSLTHDETGQVITASGDVFLEQAGRILRADQIVYDLPADKVSASGHVVINEPNGDIHYAEYMELTDQMKEGFVEGLRTYLSDGSRFSADEGQRTDGHKTTMYDAIYTPCEPCKANPERAPVWRIRASEVRHDDEAHSIAYKHARFETFGVPVAYTPYFAHPDGTIDRKSGFLAPSFGFRSNLGNFAIGKYYLDIAPDKDATFGLMAMTNQNPLGMLEYRQRWEEARLDFEGSVTSSRRRGKRDETLRGHVFSDGLWDINNKWRTGFNTEWASDDQYLRQYDFTSENVLERQIYAERFSGRNYGVGRLIAFQDTRVRDVREDQPQVLPEIVAGFVGEPNSVPLIKGRWRFEGSALGLRRDTESGQDVNRLSAKGGWDRRMISDYGLVTNVNAQSRLDYYNTRDNENPLEESETSATRFFPSLNVQSSYPVAKAFEKMQARVEPVVALTVAENIDVSDDIPNEDSQDVQIDASNIFEPNRFPGFDRVEDKSHMTYGLRSGLYGYGGSYGEVFLGQSYRFDNDDNPFPEGSGLDEQESDFVGQVSGRYADTYTFDYRFQLDGNRLYSRRHELDAAADWNRFRLKSRYLYASALEGTDISESREQLRADASYYLTKEWRARTGGVQDLGDDPGLRRSYIGLDYLGQCLFWSLTGQRNLTNNSSGESDTEIFFRIGLKNLGDFEASDLRVEENASYSSP